LLFITQSRIEELKTKLRDLDGQSVESRGLSSQYSRDLNRLRDAHSALQARYDSLLRRNESLETEASESRRKLAECTEELGRVNTSASENHAKMAALLQSVREGFDREQRNFVTQIDALKREVEQSRQHTVDLQADLEDKDKEISRLRHDHRAATSSCEFDERAKQDMEREIAALRSQLQTLSAAADAARRADATLRANETTMRDKLSKEVFSLQSL
jgi:chromosome segregation ATPase